MRKIYFLLIIFAIPLVMFFLEVSFWEAIEIITVCSVALISWMLLIGLMFMSDSDFSNN